MLQAILGLRRRKSISSEASSHTGDASPYIYKNKHHAET